MRLQTYYSLILSSLVFIVVVTLAGLLLIQFTNSMEQGLEASDEAMQQDLYQQLEDKGLSISQVLANNLTNPLYRYDTNEMYEQLNSVLNLPDIKYAIIYGPDGAIIHDGDKSISRFGQIPNDPFVAALLGSNQPLVQMSDNLLDISTPLFIGEQRLGGVRIGISTDSVHHEVKQNHAELQHVFDTGMHRNLVFVGVTSLLIMLIFGGLLAIWVSRSISRPILQLTDFARHVGADSEATSAAIPKERNDELGELAESFSDMVQRLEDSNKKVSYQANHDQLTDLPNRLLLNSFLDHAIERAARYQRKMAVMFLDIDDFKRINDTLGHASGDSLLQQFSKRLQTCLRGDDYLDSSHGDNQTMTVARLGGDEFTVILDDLESAASAAVVAQRVLERTRPPFTLYGGQEVVVGVSIGITLYPDDGSNRVELLRNADIAMYSAKSAGKNNFTFYTGSMNQEVQQRLTIERDLRRAIEAKQLELYYQPLYSRHLDRIIGVEALLRWPLPDNRFIPPETFIPIAEQTGLIVEMGQWILTRACEQTQSWLQRGLADIYCAVNLSGVQLRRQRLVDDIQQVLKDTGLPATYLHLELTETAILTNEAFAQKILAELSALGIDIWMDDFGTGFSSLSLLKKFNVQGVKIDRSFVTDMVENENSCTIVNATIAMAKSLRLGTIAEGVETQQQRALLEGLQCDTLQGYYLGKPMPACQLEQLMIDDPERFSQATPLSQSIPSP